MSELSRVKSTSIPMPPVKAPVIHSPAAQKRLDEFWRREAEVQARRARAAEHMIDFERSRARWVWWMWGVLIGAIIGWCLAVWELV